MCEIIGINKTSQLIMWTIKSFNLPRLDFCGENSLKQLLVSHVLADGPMFLCIWATIIAMSGWEKSNNRKPTTLEGGHVEGHVGKFNGRNGD